MKGIVVVAVLSFLAIGCAQRPYFYKSDTKYSQKERDLSECQYDGAKYGPTALYGGLPEAVFAEQKKNEIINRCMRLRGYYFVYSEPTWKAE